MFILTDAFGDFDRYSVTVIYDASEKEHLEIDSSEEDKKQMEYDLGLGQWQYY